MLIVRDSDTIIEYYRQQGAFGMDKYFVAIEDYVKRDFEREEDNKPLVIQAGEGVGKKTLFVKWMDYHEQHRMTKYKDVMIAHFASTGGSNTNYFYTIYRILIRLRDIFNVKYKVELLEEKIRKYFTFWLNLFESKMK